MLTEAPTPPTMEDVEALNSYEFGLLISQRQGVPIQSADDILHGARKRQLSSPVHFELPRNELARSEGTSVLQKTDRNNVSTR